MSKQTQTASGADVRDFRRGVNPNLTVAEIIDGYLVEYPNPETQQRPVLRPAVGLLAGEGR